MQRAVHSRISEGKVYPALRCRVRRAMLHRCAAGRCGRHGNGNGRVRQPAILRSRFGDSAFALLGA